MKRRTVAKLALMLAACLLAASVSAKPKLRSVDALARALAAKLPHTPGLVVYVAPPIWKGHGPHYALQMKIAEELANALSAADPSAKILAPKEAAAAVAKDGLTPFDLSSNSNRQFALYTASLIAVPVAITSEIRGKKKALIFSVEAFRTKQAKRLAKLSASIPETPQLRALFSPPAGPIKDSAGVYRPGVGGVGEPRCIYCPNPRPEDLPARIVKVGTVLLALTVEANGEVKDVGVLRRIVGPGATVLDSAAVRTVLTWKFHPAKGPDGKPVPVRMAAEITFRRIR